MLRLIMKIYFLIYFLFFTLAYCDLIPNKRVITGSDSINDYNLVEGIAYKLVHWRSDLNLGSNDGIYVDSVYSPWILRKANGKHQYNIVDVNSGLNLDSDGRRVYISSPRDNSVSNPNQKWMFTKVKDNIYNLVHVGSGLNLDSNGKDVYISVPDNNSKTNVYQRWFFEPSNYNLTAVVMDMKYSPDLKDQLEKYKSRTRLLSGNYIIVNDANATIEETIDKTELKVNSYTLEVKKSDSIKVTKYLGMSFNIGRSIFGLLGINTGFVGGIKREFSTFQEKVYRESVTEQISYHISQKITVKPFNSLMVNSTIDKITINVPFKAKIRIVGKADRLDDSGKVVSMTDVEVNALRCYLRKENFDIKRITVEGNSLLIDTVGTLEVDGYGLETKIEAIAIPHESPTLPDPEPPRPRPPLITLFIIAFVLYGLFLLRSHPNKNEYQPIL